MKSLRLLSAIFLVAAASICAAAQDRQLALASIDAVLHDTRCDTSAFLNAFMQKRWAMAELYLYRSN